MFNTSKIKLVNITTLICVIIWQTSFAESFQLKLTRITHNNYDKTFSTMQTCRIKAVSRYIQYYQIYVKFHQLPMNDLHGHFEFQKRGSGNAYKPFLYGFTFKCDFLKHLNPITRIVWGWFKDASNLNHSCPITEDFEIKRLENRYLAEKLKALPLPEGDYAFFASLSFYNVTRFDIQFYGTIY